MVFIFSEMIIYAHTFCSYSGAKSKQSHLYVDTIVGWATIHKPQIVIMLHHCSFIIGSKGWRLGGQFCIIFVSLLVLNVTEWTSFCHGLMKLSNQVCLSENKSTVYSWTYQHCHCRFLLLILHGFEFLLLYLIRIYLV